MIDQILTGIISALGASVLTGFAYMVRFSSKVASLETAMKGLQKIMDNLSNDLRHRINGVERRLERLEDKTPKE